MPATVVNIQKGANGEWRLQKTVRERLEEWLNAAKLNSRDRAAFDQLVAFDSVVKTFNDVDHAIWQKLWTTDKLMAMTDLPKDKNLLAARNAAVYSLRLWPHMNEANLTYLLDKLISARVECFKQQPTVQRCVEQMERVVTLTKQQPSKALIDYVAKEQEKHARHLETVKWWTIAFKIALNQCLERRPSETFLFCALREFSHDTVGCGGSSRTCQQLSNTNRCADKCVEVTIVERLQDIMQKHKIV